MRNANVHCYEDAGCGHLLTFELSGTAVMNMCCSPAFRLKSSPISKQHHNAATKSQASNPPCTSEPDGLHQLSLRHMSSQQRGTECGAAAEARWRHRRPSDVVVITARPLLRCEPLLPLLADEVEKLLHAKMAQIILSRVKCSEQSRDSA